MSLLHFRGKERRRTVRVALTVPLTVHGRTNGHERFSAEASSLSINQHGGLFQLGQTVEVGERLILVNDHTAESIECRVAAIRHARDGKQYVGVEFISPETDFWHMRFLIPGTKPLRRMVPIKATA